MMKRQLCSNLVADFKHVIKLSQLHFSLKLVKAWTEADYEAILTSATVIYLNILRVQAFIMSPPFIA